MPSENDLAGSIFDIIENAERIERYIAGLDRQSFEKDERTRDAVERCLEPICEAAHRLHDRAARNGFPAWRRTLGERWRDCKAIGDKGGGLPR